MMNQMKPMNKAMKIVPLFGKVRKYYDVMYDFQFNEEMDLQSERIKELKNKYAGEKCFIIGNGPSLHLMDLDLLKGQYCFGVNKFFLNDASKYCQFWGVQDSRVFADYHKDILTLDKTIFLGGSRLVDWCKMKDYYQMLTKKEVYVTKRLGNMAIEGKMSTDASNGIYIGEGVGFLCIQMAYHLGFQKVYVLGMDCDHSGRRHFYVPDSRESKLSKKTDWNDVFSCYSICRRTFEDNDRVLANVGVGGKLDVLPRGILENVV